MSIYRIWSGCYNALMRKGCVVDCRSSNLLKQSWSIWASFSHSMELRKEVRLMMSYRCTRRTMFLLFVRSFAQWSFMENSCPRIPQLWPSHCIGSPEKIFHGTAEMKKTKLFKGWRLCYHRTRFRFTLTQPFQSVSLVMRLTWGSEPFDDADNLDNVCKTSIFYVLRLLVFFNVIWFSWVFSFQVIKRSALAICLLKTSQCYLP